MTNSRTNLLARQSGGPQLVVKKARVANGGSVTRVHTVPSTLTPQMRAEIAAAVSHGRSIPQTAKEYNCDRCVVTEIWARVEISKLRGMVEGLMLRRAA